MIFWAVEEGKLVKYRRTGKCNQCGACCRDYHIGFQMEVGFVSNKNYEKQEDWSEREGWSMFVAQGTWWYFKIFEVTPADKEWHCRALTEDNKCSEWKTEKFRPICRYWPMHPSNLKHFPECGFSFEKIELEED